METISTAPKSKCPLISGWALKVKEYLQKIFHVAFIIYIYIIF